MGGGVEDRASSGQAAKARARRRFDRWAPRYELDRRSRLNTRPQEEGLAALALEARDRFLDVGCGSGAAVRAAAAAGARRAVGVDLSPVMIEQAKALAEGAASEFVVGDAEALPFLDASFDALLCSSSFHHYPEPARALGEMARVLVPGGRLALADRGRSPPRSDRRQLPAPVRREPCPALPERRARRAGRGGRILVSAFASARHPRLRDHQCATSLPGGHTAELTTSPG